MRPRKIPATPSSGRHIQNLIYNIKASLRGVAGAFDLPSILVGVVVVGILTAGVLASIFGVIPFAQDNAAKQDAAAARTAEGVAKTKDGRYMDTTDLIAAGYLSQPAASAAGATPGDGGFERASSVVPNLHYAAGVDAAKGCFLVLSRSGSGAMFYISDQVSEPTLYTPGMTTGCLTPAVAQSMADSLSGVAPAASFNTLSWTQRTGIPGMGGGPSAMSADGSVILGKSDGTGYLYKSTDSGLTWTQITSAPSTSWAGLAVSKDGQTFYAGSTMAPVGLYKSTDAGATWTVIPGTTTQQWASIAMSDDGTRVVAADSGYGGHLWVSADSGATWAQKGSWPVGYWTSVASSSDGMKLVAAQFGYNLFTSTDGGLTWVNRHDPTFTSHNWQSVASSADGTKLIAADFSNGNIYLSTDSGVTWTPQSALGTGSWDMVTSSADGTKLAVAKQNGLVYVSKDAGATWVSQDSLGTGDWQGLASSADGSKLIVGIINSTRMYTGSWG
ncbi:hypothetical protein GCM10023063_18960 [Arthrobacter methylotrophus]|uniref:Sialidase family protein n=1 Tax=Arthrobacter methylotrophus TaxID=121291 RepID=A0ABV5UPW4_9MICC